MSVFEAMASDTLIPAPAVYGSSRSALALDDIHVECLAASIVRHEHRIRRHRHSDLFQFFVIERCRADCQLDAERLQLRGAGVLIVPAMVVHQFAFSPGAAGQVVSISHALLREYERLTGDRGWLSLLAAPRWVPLAADHGVFASGAALWRCFSESGRRLHVTTSALRLVSDAVAACEQHAEPTVIGVNAQQQLVDAFIEDVERHYTRDDTIGDYCERLKVTERTLRRATTACLSLSPVVVVNRRKCLEAQRLLRFTALSVSEVAYALGFADPSYFSRQFKKVTGMSPRAVRQ
ncbi:MAG: AraC family transcriptional regulator [Pseudomonadota bacterium]